MAPYAVRHRRGEQHRRVWSFFYPSFAKSLDILFD
jgi:hypothetical protein